jgi:hypothetical protein
MRPSLGRSGTDGTNPQAPDLLEDIDRIWWGFAHFHREALGEGAMYVMGVAVQEPREQNKEGASDGRRCKGCVMRKQSAGTGSMTLDDLESFGVLDR